MTGHGMETHCQKRTSDEVRQSLPTCYGIDLQKLFLITHVVIQQFPNKIIVDKCVTRLLDDCINNFQRARW